MKPRNGNMQRPHAPKLANLFLNSVITMPQQHFKVLVFHVVGAPSKGGRW
jgi:hypothetical protein